MSVYESAIAIILMIAFGALAVYVWMLVTVANDYRGGYESLMREYHEAVRDLNRTKAEAERLRAEVDKRWPDDLVRWLCGGRVGSSSLAMVRHLTGLPTVFLGCTPRDSCDLNRCRKLLSDVPWLAERFDDMRTCSPAWAAIVDRWDDLCAMADDPARRSQVRATLQALCEGVHP